MAEKCFPSIQRLRNLDIDAETWSKFINGEIDEANLNRQGIDVETLLSWKSRVIEIARQAADMQTYLTKAEMDAVQPESKGSVAQVTNDPDSANNGYWISDGAQWLWSGVQPATRREVDAAISVASAPAPLSGEFFPFERSYRTPLITDEVGNVLLSVDEYGLPVKGWVADFHDGSSELATCFTDEGGVVLVAWNTEGEMIVGRGAGGGFEPSLFTKSVEGLAPGSAWNDHGRVSVLAAQDSFFRTDPLNLFTDISVVYGLYDELMVQFPDYITKRQLGADGLGNPIYEYSFKPADYHTLWYHETHPDLIAKPKVCIIGGTHGNERHAIATNYTMMREIAVNWRNNPISAALRWGCHIVIVPILTPSGFNSQSRYNHNGVDVNRNYPTRWETASGPKGASPLSELEAQAAVQFMTDHPDACAFIDTHNAGGLTSTGYAFWIGTERGQTLGSALKVLDHMAEYDKREYSFVAPDNSSIVRLTASGDGTAAKHVQHAFGYNGFLVETGAGFGTNYYERERHALEGVRQLVYQAMEQENQRRVREYDFTWAPTGPTEIEDD